jgi:hypothetical protein
MPARSVSVIYSELNTIFGCCEFSFPDWNANLGHMKFSTMFETPYFCAICTVENCHNSHVTKDADKQKAVRQVLI